MAILLTGISTGTNSIHAQSATASRASNIERIRQWVASELAADPKKQWLHDRADVYDRMLQIQAARALGIALSELSGAEEAQFESAPDHSKDTVLIADVSKGKFTWQNETSVAISRTQPWIVVAGANDQNMYTNGMPAYVTSNSGKTWAKSSISFGSTAVAPLGDPMLAASDDGTLYYAYLMLHTQANDNLFVATSTNGRSWTNGAPILGIDTLTGLEDKEQICVDNSPQSQYHGRVYVLWVHFNADRITGEIRLVHSDDHCKTWSTPVTIEEYAGQFGEIRTGMHGEVLISYSDPIDWKLDDAVHYFYVSTNGGSTFTKNKIADFTEYVRNLDNRPAVKGDLGPRCYPYMSFDVDEHTNTIHLVYGSDFMRLGAVQRYVTSTNLGKTWSKPTAIGYGTPDPDSSASIILDRFCPWVTVNQQSGDVFLTCYSSERDSENLNVGPFRYHLNGGPAEASTPLDTSDFDPTIVGASGNALGFIGDYIGADDFDSISASVWTKGINSDGEIFVRLQYPSSILGVSPSVSGILSSNRLRLASVFPNPAPGGRVVLSVYAPASTEARAELYDLQGKLIATLWSGSIESETSMQLEATLPPIAAGTYIIRLSNGTSSDELKISITH